MAMRQESTAPVWVVVAGLALGFLASAWEREPAQAPVLVKPQQVHVAVKADFMGGAQ